MSRASPTGTRIRDRRQELGLKQGALAAAVGISPSYLNLIEHNRRAIGGRLLIRLAEALGTDLAVLSEDGDSGLTGALQAAGAARGLGAPALAEADDLARRYPAWAQVILEQGQALAAQARTIEAMSDRLTHDPNLAEAMHELLSTVSVVRSTASILAQTPEIDPNWLGRFHVNLDEDSRRLAEGAEAVVRLFDRKAIEGEGLLLPSEGVARFLETHNHSFEALEGPSGAAAVADLVAEIADPATRALAADVLAGDAADAARLPRALVEAAQTPDDLIAAAQGDMALVLRRLGLVDPGRGLVICDAAGAMIRRKPVPGFPLPFVGGGCPLWPVYAAFAHPGHPRVGRVETPDGAGWQVHAVATPVTSPRFGAEPVLRATMLLTRAETTGKGDPVGPGCRTCPRVECVARREPSVLSQPAVTVEPSAVA